MKVLLVSIGAKFSHKTLAAHCLKSYCDVHSPQCETEVFESSINEPLGDILEQIYFEKPEIIGFSVYIWNLEQVKKLIGSLKKILPDSPIVLGGPEIFSDELEKDFPEADFFITGPGESAFSSLINGLVRGKRPEVKIIQGKNESFENLPSPFSQAYFDSFGPDKYGKIENKLIYYESSRGCPFSCSYCLSSIDRGVEYLPLERVKKDLDLLVSEGAKTIKFVDRTFNLNNERTKSILEYIASMDANTTFHFEVAADLFEDDCIELISTMPKGRVQFEIGIQSTNEKTLKTVNRRTDLKKAFKNIESLLSNGNCHVHLDLIAGLPHETLESFSEALNQCLNLKPHMLQLGFLKILKGTQIASLYPEGSMVYNGFPPFVVLKSDAMSYEDLRELKAFDRVIDKFYNSGLYSNSLDFALDNIFDSPYELFKALADFVAPKGDIKADIRRSYCLLYDFLSPFCEKRHLEHYIRLDCLTHDPKGSLPDKLSPCREKITEQEIRRLDTFKRKNFRVEYFELTEKKLLFIYDEKCPVTKAYRVIELQKEKPLADLVD